MKIQNRAALIIIIIIITSVLLTKQEVISVTRVLKHESAEADMSEILQPLKVWNGDTASIDVDIWQHQNLSVHTAKTCINKSANKSSWQEFNQRCSP